MGDEVAFPLWYKIGMAVFFLLVLSGLLAILILVALQQPFLSTVMMSGNLGTGGGLTEMTGLPIEKLNSGRTSRVHDRGIYNMTGRSTNWSGYVGVTNTTTPTPGSVSYVVGYWTVPKVTGGSQNTWSSFWSGIGGFSGNTVQQIGTEHDWSHGRQVNYAWFEMYPGGAYELVGFPVNVGDVIMASVRWVSRGVYQLILANLTRRVSFTIPVSYTRTNGNEDRSSAEVIAEAPYSGGVLPLSNFATASFSNCQMTINNVTGGFNNTHWQFDQLTMITSTGGLAKATPSSLTNNGQNFTVSWSHV